jgi:hypothetical protein
MTTDWAEWSRQAVAQMQAQNHAWLERHSLKRMPYRWNLDSAALTFARADDSVTADICVIGTVSQMLAVAGRIQNASGGFVDKAEDLTLLFTLSRFRVL